MPHDAPTEAGAPPAAPEGAPAYSFRPLTRADFHLFHEWLVHPHMGGWWADAATELALIEPEIDRGGPSDMRIVEYRGQPFAYVQDYEVHAYPMPQFADLPRGARGMDTFLGDPAYLGQGHAGRYLALRARQLIAAGAPVVAVDPDPANHRAIAAYRRAGFVPRGLRACEDGNMVQLLTFP